VIEALSGHLCRCTGYVKIVEAATAAVRGDVSDRARLGRHRAAGRGRGHADPGEPGMKAVGARLPRYDGVGHVTGRTQYVDDVRVPRMLWCKALRSPHHSALIRSLDTSAAEALPGVHAVVTHRDVPHNVYGHLEGLGVPADEPLLAEDDVRWKGQPIAAVAASRGGGARGRGGDPDRVRGARAGARHPHRADPGLEHFHQWGPIYPHFGPHNHRRVRKGDRRAGVRAGGPDRRGRLPPAGGRALPAETQVSVAVPEPSGG
jgi:xanthine dehydrogenase molybdopterin-binding subunit B